MSEDNLQEILAQAEPQEPVEQTEVQEQEQPRVDAKENDSAKNFRQLREKTERLERERDEAVRYAQQFESRNAPQKAEVEDDDFHIEADSIVEGKHLSKMAKKLKKMEQQLESYQKQSAVSIDETRLKAQYPDFDNIVTRDNIEALRTNYPELAEVINSSNNLYAQGSSAYTLIKKFGIAPNESYKADVERAQRNAAKPKPMASVNAQQGDGPLSKANAFANGLTNEVKEQLWKEMQELRKNHY